MNFRKIFPFDLYFNMINELKQRSPSENVSAFAHTDKELQRNGLLVIHGNGCSGVKINCTITKAWTHNRKSCPWFTPIVQEKGEDEEIA